MSRVGQKPVAVPGGVEVAREGQRLRVKGEKGELSMTLYDAVELVHEGNVIRLAPRDQSKETRALWGLQRSLLNNMMTGVSSGFVKELEIRGVGYRAAVEGRTLKLQLGYSRDIEYVVPEGIDVACEKPTSITVRGADKQRVGQVAAEIRAFRRPEPYKGKGIRYLGEQVFAKEGKKK